MNDHEAQRIAAAMHDLRPDWPTSSVLTLIRKNLLDRPRRDVVVALAWVASEANTSTPARVLESGPWWRAAGVEGTTTRREPWDPGGNCSTCSQPEDRCRALWADDHDYVSAAKHAQTVTAAKTDVARTVDELRGERQPMRTPAPLPDLKHQPAGRATEHVQALRAEAETTHARTAAGTNREAANAAEEAT